jgi:hypothetical protein
MEPTESRDLTRLTRGLMAARRDSLGFVEGDTPHLSAEQIQWITHRMSAATDDEATQKAKLDPDLVQSWTTDDGFLAVYGLCLVNKREAFKLLGTQLLPAALRAISVMLALGEGGNIRAATAGVELLLRSQGMLVDRRSSGDEHRLEELLGLLRDQQPVQVLDMAPRE